MSAGFPCALHRDRRIANGSRVPRPARRSSSSTSAVSSLATSRARRGPARACSRSRTSTRTSQLARFGNLLHRYTGDARYRAMSDYALRMLVTEQVAGFADRPRLASCWLRSSPRTIRCTSRSSAARTTSRAIALFQSAIRYAAVYRRIEWWDRREGNMPNPDVRYPQLSRPAAFICTDSTCSLPIFDAAKVTTEIAALGAPICEERSRRTDAAPTSSLLELQLRNAELPFQLVELAHVDRAHDVHDRELARLARDDRQAVGALLLDENVDVDVLLFLAAATSTRRCQPGALSCLRTISTSDFG